MFSDMQFGDWMKQKYDVAGANAGAAMGSAAAAQMHGLADLRKVGAANQTADAAAQEANAKSGYYSSEADLNRQKSQMLGLGFASGTSQVPGSGPPGVDTVHAMLTPKEAVLNPPAADMMGRGLIDVLNAMGALKMGMPAAMPQGGPAEASEPPGYARGTPSVQPKGKAPAPKAGAKDNGAQAAALMTFLRGMGGGGGAGSAPMAGPPAGMPGYAMGTSNVRC